MSKVQRVLWHVVPFVIVMALAGLLGHAFGWDTLGPYLLGGVYVAGWFAHDIVYAVKADRF